MPSKKTKAPTTVAGVALNSKAAPRKGKARDQSETAYLNSSSKNAARLQASAAQVKAKGRLVAGVNELGEELIDVDTLVSLLAARLGLAGAKTGVSGEVNPTASYASAKSLPTVGSSPISPPPVDAEISQMAVNLETVHALITDLSDVLQPMLAYEEVEADKAGECPSRDSESPLHRRLIDRNDTLESVIARLRYLRARVRN